jgi:hypothetical protein
MLQRSASPGLLACRAVTPALEREIQVEAQPPTWTVADPSTSERLGVLIDGAAADAKPFGNSARVD